jgi:hypothetical protein
MLDSISQRRITAQLIELKSEHRDLDTAIGLLDRNKPRQAPEKTPAEDQGPDRAAGKPADSGLKRLIAAAWQAD